MEKYTCASISRALLDRYLSVAIAATLLNKCGLKVSVIEEGKELCLLTELGRQGNVERVEITKWSANQHCWSIVWEVDEDETLLGSVAACEPKLTITPNMVCLIDETLEKNLKDITREAITMTDKVSDYEIGLLANVLGDN